MFRNQFDSEVIIYSPEGRLLQIEYAKNASKCGDSLVSFKSNSHILIISVSQTVDNLKNSLNKIYSLKENISIAISGIIGDGKLLFDLLENKIREYLIGNNINIPISYLAGICSKIYHTNTIYSGTRPFGIDVLITGYDKKGSNLFEINQEGYRDIELGTSIGKGSDIYKKLIKDIGINIKILSIDEILYYVKKFINDNQNQLFGELSNKKNYNIFFNFKVRQFFFKTHLNIKNNDLL